MKKYIFTGLFLLFVGVPSAMASHYDLLDIDIVPEAVATKLAQDKIDTTEDLFALLLSKQGRADFAKKYGFSAADVDLLAQKLELMQIVGVGPKAAKLLQLAEIDGLKKLTEADPEILLEQLLKVNREHAITGVQPDLTVVRDWISKAKKIPNRMEK